MKLIAACVCRNELNRFLEPCVAHLLEFCDEVRIVDDGSTDGWQEALRGAWGKEGKRVLSVRGSTRADGSISFNNHAALRSQLLHFALEGWPDVVLAIDLDEFCADGGAIRLACEKGGNTWSLLMEESWELCSDCICIREDGGWASHPVTMLWRPDMRRRGSYRIADKGHATGRVPQGVGGGALIGEVLHLGWANAAERPERFRRYSEGDAGKFHALSHITSIMAPDAEVVCRPRPWPVGLEAWRPNLLARSGKVPV